MSKKTNGLLFTDYCSLITATGLAIFIFGSFHIVQAAEKNIVPNPGFEEMNIGNPAGWGNLPPKWIIDRETAHSGKNSLCVRNSDPNFYANPCCTITPEPGGHYDISVWVKLENVKGGAASFMVEFWGKNGYMGGTWNAPTLSGTTGDWRRLIFENRVIPKTQVDRVTFTVFLTKGATGTAWFDDVKIEKVSSSVFETFLLHPNYRGWILPANKKKEIEMEVELNSKLLNLSLKDLELNAVLKKTNTGAMIVKDSEVVREQKWAPPPSEKFVAKIDVYDLPPGKYELLAYLRNNSGKIIDMDAYKLKKLSNEEFGKLKTYFDENCVFHVDGKPYFPLGWYTCPEWEDGEGHTRQLKEICLSAIASF